MLNGNHYHVFEVRNDGSRDAIATGMSRDEAEAMLMRLTFADLDGDRYFEMESRIPREYSTRGKV